MEPLIPEGLGKENWSDTHLSLEQWDEAYRRVESYFLALRIDNKLLLSSLVLKILGRASERLEKEPEREPVELAAEETDRYLVEWFRKVLGDEEVEQGADRLSARGRLSLLLVESDVPWQQLFLSDGPVPEDFVEAMRSAYLHADPDFSFVRMQPKPIDLGIVEVASRALGSMERIPTVVQWVLWLLFGSGLAALFFLTR